MSIEIFLTFFRFGILSFGGVLGVLPEMEKVLVVDKHWIEPQQFLQAYSIAQFLPGPNMAMCPIIGYWVNGIPGMAAGFLGIYTPSFLAMSVAALIYKKWGHLESLRRGEQAIRPVLLGLILAAILRLLFYHLVERSFIEQLSFFVLLVAGIFLSVKRYLRGLPLVFGLGLSWIFLRFALQFSWVASK